LEAHIPAGIPVASQGWQPTRKSSPWSPICIFGSPLCRDLQPGLAQFPVESRPASRHRGELPVPHSSLRSNRSPLAPRGQAGQRHRRRLISSDDLATASFPSGSGDAPFPSRPLHLLAPARVSPLLSSPLLTPFLVDLARSRGWGSPTAAGRDLTSSSGATS